MHILFIVGNVIIHHHNNTLIWNAMFPENLVCMTHISLEELKSLQCNALVNQCATFVKISVAHSIRPNFKSVGPTLFLPYIDNVKSAEIMMYQQGRIQGASRPPKLRPQHQNSTKLRPQNGSFRP